MNTYSSSLYLNTLQIHTHLHCLSDTITFCKFSFRHEIHCFLIHAVIQEFLQETLWHYHHHLFPSTHENTTVTTLLTHNFFTTACKLAIWQNSKEHGVLVGIFAFFSSALWKKLTFSQEVMFLLLFVYLSASLLDNSKTYEGIPIKCVGQIDLSPQKN